MTVVMKTEEEAVDDETAFNGNLNKSSHQHTYFTYCRHIK